MKNDTQLGLDSTYKPKIYQWNEIKDDPELLVWGYLTIEFPRFINDKSQIQFNKMKLYRDAIRKHGIEINE